MQKIRKAVIPAAGYGTRFLPATNALVNKNWTQKIIFFKFNPKFGQLHIVHDTVVVFKYPRE